MAVTSQVSMSDGKVFIMEDFGNKGEYLKISIRDISGDATVVLGSILKSDLKRVAKSL
jgi:predicted RNA-binding protein